MKQELSIPFVDILSGSLTIFALKLISARLLTSVKKHLRLLWSSGDDLYIKFKSGDLNHRQNIFQSER